MPFAIRRAKNAGLRVFPHKNAILSALGGPASGGVTGGVPPGSYTTTQPQNVVIFVETAGFVGPARAWLGRLVGGLGDPQSTNSKPQTNIGPACGSVSKTQSKGGNMWLPGPFGVGYISFNYPSRELQHLGEAWQDLCDSLFWVILTTEASSATEFRELKS